jgi:hypothetical protein
LIVGSRIVISGTAIEATGAGNSTDASEIALTGAGAVTTVIASAGTGKRD